MMRFSSVHSMIKHIPLVAGIEISMLPEQGLRIRTALVKRRWNTVSFEGGEYNLATIQEIKERIPAGTPLAVSLAGKGVIHRRVEEKNEEGNVNVLKQIMPDVSLDELYVQELKINGVRLISLVKKTEMERVVSAISQAGLTLLSLSLGPFAMLPLIPLIGNYVDQSDVLIGQHRFTFADSDLLDYTATSDEKPPYSIIRLADTEIDERLFPSFANAFCLISDIAFAQLAIPEVTTNREEYKEKLQFKRSGVVLLGVFLAMLLLNSLVFMSLSKKLNAANNDDFMDKKSSLEMLKANILASEEILNSVNLNKGDSKAMVANMADKLAASMPNELVLDELLFFPKSTGGMNSNRQPVYAFNTIQIKGKSSDIESLNNWVKCISNMTFCKKVSIKNYSIGKEEEGGFLLLISI